MFGVNPSSAESHAKFRDKRQYPFSLLVDEGQRIAKLYNCGGVIIRRTVYLIDRDGTIRFAERGTPEADRVLAAAAA